MDNNLIIDNAISEVVKEKPSAQESPRDMVERVANKFINDKIKSFPKMCEDAHKIFQKKKRFLELYGNKGKYTDSYGWSNDGLFLETHEIPTELYHFMEVFIYKDFWGKENEVIWRKFLSKVASGMIEYDAMALFVKLKKHYGDTNLVRIS